MGQVLVRNLDDRVNESWKAKSSQGRSLEQLGQELRDVLTTSLPKR
jgi:plasmid stability protein